MKMVLTAALAVLSCIFSTVILADTNRWYIGASLGGFDQNGLDDFTQSDLLISMEQGGISPGLNPTIISTSNPDSDDFGWKLYAGYQFNDHLGLEVGYLDLSSFSRRATLSGAPGFFGSLPSLTEETEIDSYGISVVGTYPISNQFSLFAKVGASNWKSETTASMRINTGTLSCFFIFGCTPDVESGSYSVSDSGTDPMFGVGATYSLGNWVLRAEWERLSGLTSSFDEEIDIDLWTLGIQYNF